MTRVARWEANKALRAKEFTEWAQWTNAVRLQHGGILIEGFIRDKEEMNRPTVRAQKYTVETDMWCRILYTKIEDTRTPMPPREVTRDHVHRVHTTPHARNSAGGRHNGGGGGGYGGGGHHGSDANARPRSNSSRQLQRNNRVHVRISSR